MKNFLLFAIISLWGCMSKDLTVDQARLLIEKEYNLPRVMSHDIHCGDPRDAKKLSEKKFEELGLVTIINKQTAQKGEPLIKFTKMADPYLLPITKEDKKFQIQKVKLADQQISNIRIWNKIGGTTMAEYTITRTNFTPFTLLVDKKTIAPEKKQVYFSRMQEQWVLENK